MEIDKIKMFLWVMVLLSACISNKPTKTAAHSLYGNSIEAEIERARSRISEHLKNNNINPTNKTMIFKILSQLKPNSESDPCYFFHNDIGINYLDRNLFGGSHGVIAFVLDGDNNYLAKSTHYTLIEGPERYNSYSFELKMIKLAQKENYLTYIELLNCNENYIIGYKKNEIDVYQYSEDDLTLTYTKKE